MQSAYRASRTSGNDPSILEAAALRRIYHQRTWTQRHPRQPAGQDPGARSGDGKGPQIDMPRLDTAVDQGRCDRKLDAGLADVICRVCNELRAAFVELVPARLGADRNAVAAGLADRLYHQLGQIIERVAQRRRFAADMGFDILEYRVLSEVGTDEAPHIGV